MLSYFTSNECVRGDICGPLWLLFQVEAKWQKAVCGALGNSLETLVVKNDEVAGQMAAHLKSIKGGPPLTARMTPYQQMASQFASRRIPYPSEVFVPKPGEVFDLSVVKAVPLAAVIQCPHELSALLTQTCSKLLLVRDADVGRSLSKSTGFDCVTLDGDKFSRSGTVTGGYRRPDNILDYANRLRTYFAQLTAAQARSRELTELLQSLTKEERSLQENRKASLLAIDETMTSKRDLARQLAGKQRSNQQLQESLSKNQEDLASIRDSIKNLQTMIAEKTKELDSGTRKKTFTEQEQQELE